MSNFKCNFRNGNDDLSCPLGCKEEDSQEIIFQCPVIISEFPEINSTGVKYAEIFLNNVSTIKSAGELLQKVSKIREQLMEKLKTI